MAGDGRPTRDLTAFVHVIDMNGRLIAQADRTPGGDSSGSYPTSIWDAGELITDHRTFQVPDGRYRIIVGLYDSLTLKREARLDQTGDSADLGMVGRLP